MTKNQIKKNITVGSKFSSSLSEELEAYSFFQFRLPGTLKFIYLDLDFGYSIL